MRVLFSGQVPKDPLFPDTNEDSYVLDIGQGRVALSDGASESFDSRTWARLLTNRFVAHPSINSTWIADVISDYLEIYKRSELSWSKQAAFDRGSFATLLGIEHITDNSIICVWGIGDSLAVLLDDYEFKDSFPYAHAEDFKQRPELISTNAVHNTFFYSDNFLSKNQKIWSIADNMRPIVLCMTDALGEWAMSQAQQGQPVWKMLAQIRDISELESLVMHERLAKNMRIDDSTLVSLAFGMDEIHELPNS